jgi:hypothetical protein
MQVCPKKDVCMVSFQETRNRRQSMRAISATFKLAFAAATAGVFAILVACGGSGGGDGASDSGVPSGSQGSDLGTAVELDSTMGLPTGVPSLGMASNGDAIVVWTRKVGNQFRAYARRYTSQGWGNAQTIDTVDSATKQAAYVVIAMNPAGQAVAAWVQQDTAAPIDWGTVWVRSFDPASGWGAAEALTVAPGSNVVLGAPAVAIAGDGAVRVLWGRSQGTFSTFGGVSYSNTSVLTRHRGAGQATWDAEEILDSEATPKYAPHILIDNAGNAVAHWTRYVDSTAPVVRFDLVARVRVAANWLSNFTVAAGVVEDDGNILAGTIAGSTIEDGRFALTWDTVDGAIDDNVTYARVFQGSAWNSTAQLGVGWMPAIAAGGGRTVATRTALMSSRV